MAVIPSPEAEHERFISWAKDQLGVTIDGVTPARLPGRGLGVLATKPLKQGDLLVSVPAKALLTTETKHVKDVEVPKEATVHARLAAYLTLMDGRDDAPHRIWQPVWPKKEEFESIMPMNWEEREKELLPAHAKSLLEKQQEKFEKDWRSLKAHLPSKDLFTYYWLIVNTRTFYWDYPTTTRTGKQQVKRRKLAPDDCMALCPFMEYFNHADEGCTVDHDMKGFTITCNREYNPGEEVFLSYGPHSNDFLLIEYGFILDSNKWDETKLDDVILSKLYQDKKDALDECGFLGNYTIDSSQICHRTQVALRALVLPGKTWRRFADGFDDGERERESVDERLIKILKQYEREIDTVDDDIQKLPASDRRNTLEKRWDQIRDIVEGQLKR
ncbi:Ribosomal lysine N-methyltransferase 2 [Lasiodiplodia hormozganensis]|uniref:Ribosomal lysine N-methyltransferase 2 n=1 Tax=Lasiodiplodia hormozganensis TaxID=869390 RepID=A0AA39Z1B0_9PEZI|nr:Ribosomal lysine N-methyltransferase 2 [Lasiodiplodia hormozganensis]